MDQFQFFKGRIRPRVLYADKYHYRSACTYYSNNDFYQEVIPGVLYLGRFPALNKIEGRPGCYNYSIELRKHRKGDEIMLNIFKKQNGMDIVGQGGKIILFMLPSLIIAIAVNTLLPQVAALPAGIGFIRPVGYILLLLGLILWGAAIIQLLTGFSKGELVTTGAYGVVRNPIYSSVTFFILPAAAFLTLTWVYLVASIFLYAGVMIFIGKEEKQLAKAFGKKYEDYLTRVDRLVPFKKPRKY